MTLKRLAGIFLVAFTFIVPAFSQSEECLDKFIKRLGERIEKATVVVNNSGNEEAKKALAEAVALYDKGVELKNQGKIKEAWTELKASSKLVAKALSLANGNNGCHGCIDNFIKRLGEQIEKAKTVVGQSNNDEAKKMLEQGIVHYEKGVELKNQNKIKEAWKELRASAKLVAKAMHLVNGNNGCHGCIDKWIKNTEAKIAQAKKVVDPSTNDEAKKILAEAVTHYEKGLELNKAGKVKEAKAELRKAMILANKAIKLVQGL